MDFDSIVRLEDALAADLSQEADVDGHDKGSGEANIFILTSDPEHTFHRVQRLLSEKQQANARMAYRALDQETYTVLWPHDLKGFAVK